MSSKRGIRRRACKNKIRHETMQDARAAIKQGRHRTIVIAYKCQFCGGFHVGRPNRRQRQGFYASRGMEAKG